MKDKNRVDIAPNEAATNESGNENDAVYPLVGTACQVELVEEPVEVVEWGRELIEDKDGGVVVDKGALREKLVPSGKSCNRLFFISEIRSISLLHTNLPHAFEH